MPTASSPRLTRAKSQIDLRQTRRTTRKNKSQDSTPCKATTDTFKSVESILSTAKRPRTQRKDAVKNRNVDEEEGEAPRKKLRTFELVFPDDTLQEIKTKSSDSDNNKENLISKPTEPPQLKSQLEPQSVPVPPKEEEEDQSLNSIPISIIKAAKSIFRTCADSVEIIGRDSQRMAIEQFVNEHIVSTQINACLYISGAPGTGKTVLTSDILRRAIGGSIHGNVKLVEINCMLAGANPRRIFPLIYSELVPSTDSHTIDECIRLLEQEVLLVNSASKTEQANNLIVILLDEVDQLMTKDQEVLYRIFEWPFLKNSRLCLIGIANSLDLTERFLPRLRAKHYNPQILAFPAYTHTEISAMIKSRLDSVVAMFPDVFAKQTSNDTVNSSKNTPAHLLLMQNAAIELCAKKVAAYGDFRKAIDICRYAFELLEKELKNQQQQTIISPPIPKLTVKHVLKVLDLAFGSGNPTVAKIQALNPHQKTLLVVIAQMERSRPKPSLSHLIELTIMRTFETYISICRQMKIITEVSRSEFLDIVGTLESIGLVSIMKPTNSSNPNSGKNTPRRNSAKNSPAPNSATLPSTPQAKTPFQLIKGTATPTSHSKSTTTIAKTPKSTMKIYGSPAQTKSGYMMDPANRIALNCNDQELEMGVKTLGFVHELLVEELPVAVLQQFHTRAALTHCTGRIGDEF